MEFEAADDSRKERFKEDFDFEKSREEFEKKKDEFHKAKEEAKKDSTYDKSADFFDTISCDQKDQRNPRQDRDDMKRADQETFGADMVGNMRFRRGGGGRGRGGRGRFNRY
ncbi:hypothetical protein AGDE_00894 [Angomonas deanei]|nr:hypothetical protein AGDE_00894 [Angomonas deanei]|eukprot:EPY43029.1 hypothetical protein AGDE_00894 [Angomonas deanei]